MFKKILIMMMFSGVVYGSDFEKYEGCPFDDSDNCYFQNVAQYTDELRNRVGGDFSEESILVGVYYGMDPE